VPYGFYAQPIGRGALASLRDDPKTQIHSCAVDDPLVRSFPRAIEVIQARFEAGAECYAARIGDRFAGHIWIARTHYDEDEVRCRYKLRDPATAVWDFDVYVDPGLRLGRTMARLWKSTDQALSENGIRWSMSRISMFNPQSSSSHARLGAVYLGRAVFLIIGPVQLTVSSLAPFLHLGLTEASTPEIWLNPPPA